MSAIPISHAVNTPAAAEPESGPYRYHPTSEVLAIPPIGGCRMRLKRAREKWQADPVTCEMVKAASSGLDFVYRGDLLLGDQPLCNWISRSRPLFDVPDEVHKRGIHTEIQANLAAQRYVAAIEQIWCDHSHLGQWTDRFFAHLVNLCGETIREFNFPTSKSGLIPFMRRVKARHPISLKRGRSGRKALAVDPRLIAAVNTAALDQGLSAPLAHEYQAALARELNIEPLTRWQVRTYLHDIPAAEKAYATGGTKALDNRMPSVRRWYKKLAPMQVVHFDGTLLNFMAQRVKSDGEVVPQRPTLIVFLDLATRMIVGWQFTFAERVEDVLIGCKRVCQIATPEKWYCDNGSAFLSALGSSWQGRVELMTRSLNSTVTNSIPGLPRARGMGERLNRTIHSDFDRDPQFAHCFWGRTQEERPEGADKYTSENPDKLPTLEQLDAAFASWVKIYHERPHSGDGMDGLAPRQKWDAWFADHPDATLTRHSNALIDWAAGKVVGPRTVGPQGIEYENETFGAGDLQVLWLQSRKVWLRIDPEWPGMIALVEENGTPILARDSDEPIVAMVGQMTDRTPAELRDAIAKQKRCKKAVKAFYNAREFLDLTKSQTMLTSRALAADARREAERSQSGAGETPPVRLAVTPESAAAQKFSDTKAELQEKNEQKRSGVKPDKPRRRSGFDLIASDGAPSAAEPSRDLWATFIGEAG